MCPDYRNLDLCYPVNGKCGNGVKTTHRSLAVSTKTKKRCPLNDWLHTDDRLHNYSDTLSKLEMYLLWHVYTHFECNSESVVEMPYANLQDF